MTTTCHNSRLDDLRDPHNRLDGAVSLIRSGRLDEALCLTESVLASSSADLGVLGRAHSFRGEVASIRGVLDETVKDYAIAIDCLEKTPLVGSLARARRGRAEAYLNLGLYTSALEESARARTLVESIADETVRRRAQLESTLCEGLIRVDLSQRFVARALWEAAADLLDHSSDPLLVGLNHLLGGLVLADDRASLYAGFELLDRAARHFGGQGLVYYRARTLEEHGRRMLALDSEGATARVEEAGRIYGLLGASLRRQRTTGWLAQAQAARSTKRLSSKTTDNCNDSVDEVEGIVLAGPSTRALVEATLRAANTTSTVLITGESGTGKEAIARLIHKRSRRAGQPWIPFNCAAVPSEMVESVLFGHRRGAFTGAVASHEGLVRAAQGGTLLLDEIGELPPFLQAKLLRFLQEGEVLPLGETRPVTVDVRIVAATNRSLERDVAEGRFRADLYHRLNVVRLQIAPLRERRDEIPVLAKTLARVVGDRIGVSGVEMTAGAIGPLISYDWPGNVRELANMLERALALDGPCITRGSIEQALDGLPSGSSQSIDPLAPLTTAMDGFERQHIRRALCQTQGNCSRAAAHLGVSLQRLRYRMRRLGLG